MICMMLTLGKAPRTGSHTHFPKTRQDQAPLPLHQTFMRTQSSLDEKPNANSIFKNGKWVRVKCLFAKNEMEKLHGSEVALFDISIWHIDCRYIDTFEKHRYRYRYWYEEVENIDIDKVILENIDINIDIDMVILENIDIDIDIDKAIPKISISIWWFWNISISIRRSWKYRYRYQ